MNFDLHIDGVFVKSFGDDDVMVGCGRNEVRLTRSETKNLHILLSLLMGGKK